MNGEHLSNDTLLQVAAKIQSGTATQEEKLFYIEELRRIVAELSTLFNNA